MRAIRRSEKMRRWVLMATGEPLFGPRKGKRGEIFACNATRSFSQYFLGSG
jgi:hypothetical protein